MHISTKHILSFLAPNLQRILENYPSWSYVEEIRLRIGRPLILRTNKGEVILDTSGTPTRLEKAYSPSAEDISRTAQIMTENSWYALEDEIRSGYITLPGGHRVGISGKVLLDNGKIRNFKYIGGLNIRIAHDVTGAASKLAKYIFDINGSLSSMLIISPPGCGKTTLLRDVARQVSERGFQSTIIDERSEIAACYRGVPQLNVGSRTDVIDGCPKGEGIQMALRGLAPEVIITDEIGHPSDASVLADLVRAGVKVITSCHGSSVEEVQKREWALLGWAAFDSAVILSRRNGPGTIENVLKLKSRA